MVVLEGTRWPWNVFSWHKIDISGVKSYWLGSVGCGSGVVARRIIASDLVKFWTWILDLGIGLGLDNKFTWPDVVFQVD